MIQPQLTAHVQMHSPVTAVITLRGEMNLFAEKVLMDAYTAACDSGAQAVVLDFAGLSYMNSAGIGLLVTLLLRARRNGHRLMACGLQEHYREIFRLTRLEEAIPVIADARDAESAPAPRIQPRQAFAAGR